MRGFLRKALEKAGHVVVDSAQGDEALNELQLREFDLLLTDIVMPVMDGIELARRASDIDPSMKIMFITGFAAVALNPANRGPRKTPKCCQNPSTFGIWSRKSTACWPRPKQPSTPKKSAALRAIGLAKPKPLIGCFIALL